MKKLKKSLISLILFLFYTNNIYATTTGTYTVEKSHSFQKILILIVGIGLISLVLFCAYKMDKNEATKKRRQKFIKENKRNDIDEERINDYRENQDIYSNIYTTRSSREANRIKEGYLKYMPDSVNIDDEEDEDIQNSDTVETPENEGLYYEAETNKKDEEIENDGLNINESDKLKDSNFDIEVEDDATVNNKLDLEEKFELEDNINIEETSNDFSTGTEDFVDENIVELTQKIDTTSYNLDDTQIIYKDEGISYEEEPEVVYEDEGISYEEEPEIVYEDEGISYEEEPEIVYEDGGISYEEEPEVVYGDEELPYEEELDATYENTQYESINNNLVQDNENYEENLVSEEPYLNYEENLTQEDMYNNDTLVQENIYNNYEVESIYNIDDANNYDENLNVENLYNMENLENSYNEKLDYIVPDLEARPNEVNIKKQEGANYVEDIYNEKNDITYTTSNLDKEYIEEDLEYEEESSEVAYEDEEIAYEEEPEVVYEEETDYYEENNYEDSLVKKSSNIEYEDIPYDELPNNILNYSEKEYEKNKKQKEKKQKFTKKKKSKKDDFVFESNDYKDESYFAENVKVPEIPEDEMYNINAEEITSKLNSTMVFNTEDLKKEEKIQETEKEEKDIDVNITVKGYDFSEEDIEELENHNMAPSEEKTTGEENNILQDFDDQDSSFLDEYIEDDSMKNNIYENRNLYEINTSSKQATNIFGEKYEKAPLKRYTRKRKRVRRYTRKKRRYIQSNLKRFRRRKPPISRNIVEFRRYQLKRELEEFKRRDREQAIKELVEEKMRKVNKEQAIKELVEEKVKKGSKEQSIKEFAEEQIRGKQNNLENEYEDLEDTIQEVEKPKRGRKPKSEIEEPKRGRKPKTVEAENAPKKRGRKPKVEEKVEGPKKRGRKPKTQEIQDDKPRKRGRPKLSE